MDENNKKKCMQQTMMKFRVVKITTIAQAALATQHASRRSIDGAIRCNRNTGTNIVFS